MANQNIYDLAETWNDGATTFDAIKFNVTDTASAAASNLINLQVGGTTQFRVGKDGYLYANRYLSNSGEITMQSANGFYSLRTSGGGDSLQYNSAGAALWIRSNVGQLSFGTASDLNIIRTGSGTVDIRPFSSGPTTINTYNARTDASNYERGFLKWDTNEFVVGAEAAGTGTYRLVKVLTENSSSYVLPQFRLRSFATGIALDGNDRVTVVTNGVGVLAAKNTSGVIIKSDRGLGWSSGDVNGSSDAGFKRAAAAVVAVTDGSSGNGAAEFGDMTAPATPAANTCRVYAKDNGAGKTQLVVLMPDGAETVLATEA